MSEVHRYGENPAVTGFGVDNAVVNIGGVATEFRFENGQCVPVPSLWQQGAVRTLFYRTLNNGTNDINVLCGTDGKLIIGDGENPSYVEYLVNNDQIGLRTANRDALIAAAGGSVVADVFSDDDGNYIMVSLDDYTVVADLDGIVVQGDITEWPVSTLVRSIQVPYSGGNVNIPVDKYGRVMVKHDADGNVNYTPWWVDGNQIAVFDDAADQVLVDAMRDHGYVDCLSFTQASDITVTLDGQSEHLVFSSETKKFNMFVPGWQNALVSLNYHDFIDSTGAHHNVVFDNNSGSACTVTVDGESKVLLVKVVDNVKYIDFANLADIPGLNNLSAGTRELTLLESSVENIGDTFVIVNDKGADGIFVVATDQDGYYRDGSAVIPERKLPVGLYVRQNLTGGPGSVLVNEEGRALKFNKEGKPSFCIIGINNGEYGYETDFPLGLNTIDIPFSGEYPDNGNFEYNGITYTCVNYVMNPVVSNTF